MLFDDTYQTITEPAEGFFKDRGSKFFSYAYPITEEADAKAWLHVLRELHPKAVHHCYAYRLGQDRMSYRQSDDGEPAGTAGRPILNVLYSQDVTNVLVVVVRYFGGTLLGVPGLINAYKTGAESALSEAVKIRKHLFSTYEIKFAYVQMNDVMRIVKELDLPVVRQNFEMECSLVVEVRSTLVERFMTRTGLVLGITTKEI